MPLTNFTFGVRGAAPVQLTTATVTLTPDAHAYRPLVLNRAAGIATTLPIATGSGDKYSLYIQTTFTSSATIKVVGADVMTGYAITLQDVADTMVGFETASDSDTITFNGTTTGGLLGAQVELVDLAAGLWGVSVIGAATGTEATPFSATVS